MTDPADVVVFLDRQWTPGLVPTNDARPLGPATTRWSDYVGTASADDAEVRIGAPSLYELSGLDRGLWRIVGMDLVLQHRAPSVVVYAVATADAAPSTSNGTTGAEALQVTAFRLEEPEQVDAFLGQAFETLQVRLVVREHRDALLVPKPANAALEATA
jgi:hypothetical protein